MRYLLNAKSVTALALLAAATFGGCGGGESDPEEEGEPTGATCPSGSTLTYENFAQPFMEAYCTRCHSSTLMEPEREGAPPGHDFDTEDGILLVAHHVDEMAAAGPNATNEFMPPSDPKPTVEERRKLGEWIACEHEAQEHDAGGTPADGGQTPGTDGG